MRLRRVTRAVFFSLAAIITDPPYRKRKYNYTYTVTSRLTSELQSSLNLNYHQLNNQQKKTYKTNNLCSHTHSVRCAHHVRRIIGLKTFRTQTHYGARTRKTDRSSKTALAKNNTRLRPHAIRIQNDYAIVRRRRK